MAPDEFPLPYEYRFIQIENLVTEPPADLEERTIVFLDCGNIDRNPADSLKREGAHILNVDHHHDNTQFGTVNLVVPEASCTAEVIWDLTRDLGVSLTRPIAEALYVGLITDTGSFRWASARAHRLAARLVELGVDNASISRALLDTHPFAWLPMLSRVLASAQLLPDAAEGRGLVYAVVGHQEWENARPEEVESIVDIVRTTQQAEVAAVFKEIELGHWSVSMRSKSYDLATLASTFGGGGHLQAAGYSATGSADDVVHALREALH